MSNHRVEILSLWAWWRLPGAFGLAPLLCDNTWQVALPMTSNPKAVQKGQRSFSKCLSFWGREIRRRGQCSQIAAYSPEQQQQDRHTRPNVGRLVSTRAVL